MSAVEQPGPESAADATAAADPIADAGARADAAASVESAADAREILVDRAAVTVRRSPRYLNFMILGGAAGALAALLLTVSFPSNAEFGLTQVFGFLLLAGVVAGVTLGAVAAIAVDRATARSVRTVVVDRLGAYSAGDPVASAEAGDTPTTGEDPRP